MQKQKESYLHINLKEYECQMNPATSTIRQLPTQGVHANYLENNFCCADIVAIDDERGVMKLHLDKNIMPKTFSLIESNPEKFLLHRTPQGDLSLLANKETPLKELTALYVSIEEEIEEKIVNYKEQKDYVSNTNLIDVFANNNDRLTYQKMLIYAEKKVTQLVTLKWPKELALVAKEILGECFIFTGSTHQDLPKVFDNSVTIFIVIDGNTRCRQILKLDKSLPNGIYRPDNFNKYWFVIPTTNPQK